MNKEEVLLISTVSIVTILLRFLPFLIFNNKKETPKIIVQLGNILPFAIMGMLVIYCYKDISFFKYPFGLSEIIAGIIVVILHIWKKNTLLSIICGTVIYMVLIQFVFI